MENNNILLGKIVFLVEVFCCENVLRKSRKSCGLLQNDQKWLRLCGSILVGSLLNLTVMRPEEVLVMRVLRFVVVASLAVALAYMAYTG